jgi:hypothetical protein
MKKKELTGNAVTRVLIAETRGWQLFSLSQVEPFTYLVLCSKLPVLLQILSKIPSVQVNFLLTWDGEGRALLESKAANWLDVVFPDVFDWVTMVMAEEAAAHAGAHVAG